MNLRRFYCTDCGWASEAAEGLAMHPFCDCGQRLKFVEWNPEIISECVVAGRLVETAKKNRKYNLVTYHPEGAVSSPAIDEMLRRAMRQDFTGGAHPHMVEIDKK